MSKNNLKWLIILGVLCVICVAAATGYSLNFNEGRLVYPMDFNSYQFQVKDIPMILALIITVLYVIYLAASIIIYGMVVKREGKKAGRTRKVNPKMGYLGYLGFAGFAGIGTYLAQGIIIPFVFWQMNVSCGIGEKRN